MMPLITIFSAVASGSAPRDAAMTAKHCHGVYTQHRRHATIRRYTVVVYHAAIRRYADSYMLQPRLYAADDAAMLPPARRYTLLLMP